MSDQHSDAKPGKAAAPASPAAPASSAASPGGSALASTTWNKVDQPGSYVCNDTGRLLRVPASGVNAGKAPVIEFFGPQGPSKVTRLSENPHLPVVELRNLATGASIKPQF